MLVASCLLHPGSDCLLDPSAWRGAEEGGQKNDSGRAPGWGVEVPALAGPGGREWRLLVPAAVKGNRDGTIKTQRRGVIVQNYVQPTKKKLSCFVPTGFQGFGGYCPPPLNCGPTQF